MKAVCKIPGCNKMFFRPTLGELGERMKQHLQKTHKDVLGEELVKAQVFIGIMVIRHFDGVPDLEKEKSNALAREQLIEMLQGKRDCFDDSSLNPAPAPAPASAPGPVPVEHPHGEVIVLPAPAPTEVA